MARVGRRTHTHMRRRRQRNSGGRRKKRPVRPSVHPSVRPSVVAEGQEGAVRVRRRRRRHRAKDVHSARSTHCTTHSLLCLTLSRAAAARPTSRSTGLRLVVAASHALPQRRVRGRGGTTVHGLDAARSPNGWSLSILYPLLDVSDSYSSRCVPQFTFRASASVYYVFMFVRVVVVVLRVATCMSMDSLDC